MSIKVTDPVCGMQVDPAKSKGSFDYKGTTYHFCSLRCLEKFKNDREGILARGVPKREPAKGSALTPVAPGAPLYTCPMHPEVRQDHPGSCPKCGMALEPETVTVDEGPNPELLDMRRRFWIGVL